MEFLIYSNFNEDILTYVIYTDTAYSVPFNYITADILQQPYFTDMSDGVTVIPSSQ